MQWLARFVKTRVERKQLFKYVRERFYRQVKQQRNERLSFVCVKDAALEFKQQHRTTTTLEQNRCTALHIEIEPSNMKIDIMHFLSHGRLFRIHFREIHCNELQGVAIVDFRGRVLFCNSKIENTAVLHAVTKFINRERKNIYRFLNGNDNV